MLPSNLIDPSRLTPGQRQAEIAPLFGAERPGHSRRFVEKRIAYRWQEIEFRKTDRNLIDRNQRRIDELIATGSLGRYGPGSAPMVGTVLTRYRRGNPGPDATGVGAPAGSGHQPTPALAGAATDAWIALPSALIRALCDGLDHEIVQRVQLNLISMPVGPRSNLAPCVHSQIVPR